jgi:GNAT superfamily N-acetyltransferase
VSPHGPTGPASRPPGGPIGVPTIVLADCFFSPDYREEALLRDGTVARLRLLRPDDLPLLRDGFERLSAQARYQRFLSPKPTLHAEELRYLTEVDQLHHVALGAVSGDEGAEIGLGVARFICLAEDPTIAEAAITVADDAQHKGLGTLLFMRLVAAACERGVTRFRCEVLCANAGMHELIHTVARSHTSEVHSGVVTMEFELPNVAPAEPATAVPRDSAIYRMFRLVAEGVVEWTSAVARRLRGP